MKRLGCRETTFFFALWATKVVTCPTTFFFSFVITHVIRKAKEGQPSFLQSSFFLHFFAQIFAYIKKKQYFCTRF